MSSTHKTEELGLNRWIGSDIPQREDFNADNQLIDTAISQHTKNGDIHISAAERNRWSSPYYFGTYTGNGNASRTVVTGCDFTPEWGILFAVNRFPTISDYENQAQYNYFAVMAQDGGTSGVTFSGKNLTVVQSSVAVSRYNYRSFNENGQMYVYILFR